jgi:hypothetical protein
MGACRDVCRDVLGICWCMLGWICVGEVCRVCYEGSAYSLRGWPNWVTDHMIGHVTYSVTMTSYN